MRRDAKSMVPILSSKRLNKTLMDHIQEGCPRPVWVTE